jgi:hypothetical protein
VGTSARTVAIIMIVARSILSVGECVLEMPGDDKAILQ